MSTTASAYVRQGRLCIVGLHECELGPVPFTHTVEVAQDVEDGPVDIGAEEQDPKIAEAIAKAKEPMLSKIEEEKMRITAEQWVERARAGDQNAMALIQGVRHQAERGVARAKKAFSMLAAYIKAHPVDMTDGNPQKYLPAANKVENRLIRKLAQFVGDDAAICAWAPQVSKNDPYLAALILSDGPNLSKTRVKNIGAHFGEDEDEFWAGVEEWDGVGSPDGSDAMFAGRAVGHARVLQGVRAGAYPISRLCERAGWELGE